MRPTLLAAAAGAVLGVVAGCHPATPLASRPLRVLVYNIHAGKDAGGVDNLARVAAIVNESDADVALLQEVDRGTRRSGGVDQPAVLARATGRHVAFGRTLDFDGGQYGIAILSRWPIRTDTLIHLPIFPPQQRAGGSYEPRGALVAAIEAPGELLRVVNTHLDASGTDQYRTQEVRTIVRIADSLRALRPAGRLLIGGDFNSTPESAVQQVVRDAKLRDAWTTCGGGEGPSFPASVPRKRIDYLLLDGGSCASARVLETQASDHRPVFIEVTR
ncbi:MAG: endonuclease/exonuclease/phosphatase family protein [Gemmatimonadaceae bacterium]